LPKLKGSKRVRSQSLTSKSSQQDTDNRSDYDIESVSDYNEASRDVVDRVPDYNDWAIVNKPESKFHGHPCQMKNLVGNDSRRANIYVYSNGKYELHSFICVKHKHCRFVTQEEISLLRTKLGEPLVEVSILFL
jgi:hypothetical protein